MWGLHCWHLLVPKAAWMQTWQLSRGFSFLGQWEEPKCLASVSVSQIAGTGCHESTVCGLHLSSLLHQSWSLPWQELVQPIQEAYAHFTTCMKIQDSCTMAPTDSAEMQSQQLRSPHRAGFHSQGPTLPPCQSHTVGGDATAGSFITKGEAPWLAQTVHCPQPLLRWNSFVNHTQHHCNSRLRRLVYINHMKIYQFNLFFRLGNVLLTGSCV